MNTIKRYLAIIWILLGPVAVYYLVKTAASEIAKKPVIDTKIQWAVFIIVFLPIAIGMVIFGYYALKGEYDHFSQTAPYQIHSNAITTSQLINTQQIGELLKKSSKTEEGSSHLTKIVEQVKEMEKEIKIIKEHLSKEQVNIVEEFISFNKKLKKDSDNKEARTRVNELDERLLENEIISEEEMKQLMLYCEKLVELEQQTEKQGQLQANIETPTNK